MNRMQKLAAFGIAGLMILSCSLFEPKAGPSYVTPTQAVPAQVATTVPSSTEAQGQAVPTGIAVDFPGGRLSIPEGLATGASSEGIPAVSAADDMPWWGIAPAHVQIKLQGYALQGRFHEPQIVIYPAAEYAAMNESIAEHIQQLQGLLADPAALSPDASIPGVPFFNAGALIDAQLAVVPFPGGRGVREVTEYAQFYAPINNNDLFYHFEGLTDDGKTFIVAILPITGPLLAENGDEGTLAPAGGVPFPGFSADPSTLEAYYLAMESLLNATSADSFTPSLLSLDALVGSIAVSP